MNSKRSSIGGCPIRESSDLCLFPAPRSVSPASAPFIVSECLGLHRKPLFLWPKKPKKMNFFIFFLSRIFLLRIHVVERVQKKAVPGPCMHACFTARQKNIKKSMDHFFFTRKRKKEGGNRGIRTLGPCLAKAVLYQLSYIPIFAIFFFLQSKKRKKKAGPYWTWTSEPLAYQASALPTELMVLCFSQKSLFFLRRKKWFLRKTKDIFTWKRI